VFTRRDELHSERLGDVPGYPFATASQRDAVRGLRAGSRDTNQPERVVHEGVVFVRSRLSREEYEQHRVSALVTGLALCYNARKVVSARAGEGEP
jgi:hypothetical protein